MHRDLLKVVHVCNGHSVDDGRVFHRACVTLAEAGYEVHLLAQGDGTIAYENKAVLIHPLPACKNRLDRFRRASVVARLAAELEPDLFHVHEPDLLGPVLSRAGSRPVIYDVHESFLDMLSDSEWLPFWAKPFARTAWDYRERSLVRRCAGVIAVTKPIAQRYVPLNANVSVVANYPEWHDHDLNVPIERDGYTCVMAGSVSPTRGLPQILRAMASLHQRGIPVRLALAGILHSKDYLEALWEEAERLGIRQHVEYHGVLPKSEAMIFQRKADIGLVTYLPFGNCKVGLPNKLLECMALGLPVVCSDFPVFREVAGNGPGILVDPTKPEQIADAIETLIRNPVLAQQMGKAGQLAVRERFNWAVESEKLISMYESILHHSSTRGYPRTMSYMKNASTPNLNAVTQLALTEPIPTSSTLL